MPTNQIIRVPLSVGHMLEQSCGLTHRTSHRIPRTYQIPLRKGGGNRNRRSMISQQFLEYERLVPKYYNKTGFENQTLCNWKSVLAAEVLP
jgi:hypothetical protein